MIISVNVNGLEASKSVIIGYRSNRLVTWDIQHEKIINDYAKIFDDHMISLFALTTDKILKIIDINSQLRALKFLSNLISKRESCIKIMEKSSGILQWGWC